MNYSPLTHAQALEKAARRLKEPNFKALAKRFGTVEEKVKRKAYLLTKAQRSQQQQPQQQQGPQRGMQQGGGAPSPPAILGLPHAAHLPPSAVRIKIEPGTGAPVGNDGGRSLLGTMGAMRAAAGAPPSRQLHDNGRVAQGGASALGSMGGRVRSPAANKRGEGADQAGWSAAGEERGGEAATNSWGRQGEAIQRSQGPDVPRGIPTSLSHQHSHSGRAHTSLPQGPNPPCRESGGRNQQRSLPGGSWSQMLPMKTGMQQQQHGLMYGEGKQTPLRTQVGAVRMWSPKLYLGQGYVWISRRDLRV